MYTLAQACILLRVSRATLNRWLHTARMKPTRSAMEHRRYFLTAAQLAQLAKKHKRRLTVSSPKESELALQLSEAGIALEERVALLEAQVAMLLAAAQ